MFAPLAAGLR